MRLALRIDPLRRASYVAICAALISSAWPAAVGAQSTPGTQAQSATLADSGESVGVASSNLPSAPVAATDDTSLLAALTPSPAVDAATVNDISLDDQVLSRQRGGAVGMVMVAATPQLRHGSGNQVTLWDEIAPPSPLPVPLDAARAAQGNVATYQRK
ncbi:hypothetical protein LJ656_20740 [Paraburkholderia sp. MMS20-SJTR3]|uniref:Uncharacterized protein n=1 Tax=Paraburkholderia sejongensis TaxID=2886946 RepID=A0ABS8JYP7_9BURK|nr:hypothetical protein [Paraburkholderia sp. MMS20-SJTR3]MCC8395022.1 hypothetical protein [Paraburkholderia sp. MMS20-SJTR3]